jgi:hypothetical protein
METTIFWDVGVCRLVKTDISEVLTYSIIRVKMMEVVNISETSVNLYQTTQCNIPKDSVLQVLMSVLKHLIIKVKVS